MKKAVLFFCLLMAATSVQGQTITLGPITKLAYCEDDTLVVPYQASGTFAADNLFKAQLSDANGYFISFTLADSNVATTATLLVPMGSLGSHYRVRVESTDPYTVSIDNGVDIQVLALLTPTVYILPGQDVESKIPWAGYSSPVGVVNRAIRLTGDLSPDSGSFVWNFGQDGVPIQSISRLTSVIYSTAGEKTGSISLTNTSGCTSTVPFSYEVLTCHPIIPAWAQIITGTEEAGDRDTATAVWVKAGGSFTANGDMWGRTVFVEPGGTLISSEPKWNVYYLKKGAGFSFGGSPEGPETVVLDTSMTLTFPRNTQIDTCACDNLDFDYSQVNASVAQPGASSISIRQSGDALFVEGEGNLDARVFNLLGNEIYSKRGAGTLDLDLSSLPAGVYFAIVQAGDAREVKRIAVVH